ncbi:MAG: sulfatase/phosphatase domain-containing protein [Chloroflexia bacterium]
MLDALKSLDLLENTVVVFTSDHGCHFKTRNSEYKRSCHESSIRVPTAFRGGPFDGGGRLRELVSLVDLAPTLLDAAGLTVPDDMQGRSILPLLRGERHGWPEEVFVQISESEVGRAVRTGRWKYSVVAPDSDPALEAGCDRYVEQHLYDLEADPYELTDLLGLESHRNGGRDAAATAATDGRGGREGSADRTRLVSTSGQRRVACGGTGVSRRRRRSPRTARNGGASGR